MSTTSDQAALLTSLTELALDLHWSWNHATDEVWRQLDETLWNLTHNPLAVLQAVSQEKIRQVFKDPVISGTIEQLIQTRKRHANTPAWFQKTYPNTPLTCIAYFSMEFMLSEALPIYSGGLGNVAGDHLKTASDLGVPLIGIGLLYQQGYSRQIIHEDGSQQYIAPFNDPGQLPVSPLRKVNGEWLRIEVKLPGFSVWLRTWKVIVGRSSLFLLDSNDSANFPVHRCITNELYASGSELRFFQELILGMGGWRLLKELKIKPEVCHLNEGHSAFLVVERALSFMEENNQPFHVALRATRSGNIFTTHTAVSASFDLFPPSMIEQYLGTYIKERLKISLKEFCALGRQDPEDETALFNTGYLAIRGSFKVNGVSRLHGEVSRQLFANIFPRWPLQEVPIGYVTNGVHMPTWDSPEADKLWTEICGKDRWLGSVDSLSTDMGAIPDQRIWAMRTANQETFIEYIRIRYAHQLSTIGAPIWKIEAAKRLFNTNALTLGFARRFASYKRPNLLLKKPERLQQILTIPDKPVQLIIAGKAHPADKEGQTKIKEWMQFIKQYGLEEKVIFLSDYDMLLTEHLVQGVDLWINTPRRPWEACGTSGMKVLVNGGLNVSTRDGWWDEAYNKNVGWVIGDGLGLKSENEIDQEDADMLYNVLENQIVPEFYDQNEVGIPVAWVNRIRQSMAGLTPKFSSNRSLQTYVEELYLPAAHMFEKRSAEKGNVAVTISNWENKISKEWPYLRFEGLSIQSDDTYHHFTVKVFLHELLPEDICVELFAEGLSNSQPERVVMLPLTQEDLHSDITLYSAAVSVNRLADHYTPRIIPNNHFLAVPLELNQILWFR